MLRLVRDLQHCIKAQQSKTYAGKVKLTNLQTMAKTLSYVQGHGYNTVEDAENKLAEIKELASSSRKELKDIEGRPMSRSTIPDNTLPTNPSIRSSLRSRTKDSSVRNILRSLPFMKQL